MAKINVGHCNITGVLQDASDGFIKIPQFQRKYVWSVKECAKLLDSILKGYPVGSLIYWKTKETLREVRNVGNFHFPPTPSDDYIYYVLDGQQRITSIIACLTGQIIDEEDYSKIYINLLASEEEDIVVTDISDLSSGDYISLTDLYTFSIIKITQTFKDESMIEKINDYHERITNYQFSKIELTDAPLTVATEVFTRINTAGKSLSAFEIMCAKLYSEDPVFDLYEERQKQKASWALSSYDTIQDTTVLQAVSACLCKSCKGKDILSLDKTTFINEWSNVCNAFDMTIDYFKNTYGVPVSKLVPYEALYVPFVYYFYNKKTRPTGNARDYLKDYFWRAAFSSRFTEGAVSKINQDITNVMDVILAGKKPTYDRGLVISKESIQREGTFSTGNAFVKGILCILCAKNPQSFVDGHLVAIDNTWLSQGNSKNYHHFFPKDYMKKSQPLIQESLVNHIVNITIVDGWLNKGLIKNKAPSIYMNEFLDEGHDVAEYMKTHLIDNLDDFGIFTDDYNAFFESRIKRIHTEMVALLIKQEADDFTFEPQVNNE